MLNITSTIRQSVIHTTDFVREPLVKWRLDLKVYLKSRRAIIYTEQKKDELKEAADSKWLTHLLEQPTMANLAIVPVCIVLQAVVSLMLASQSILVCVTLMLNVLYRFDE